MGHMSVIDHNKRRIEQQIKLILSACSGLGNITNKEAFERLQHIKNAAEVMLSYIPDDPAPVGEWIDITTMSDHGFRVEMNSVTGERRHIPVEPKIKTMVVTYTGVYAPVMSEQFKQALKRDFPNTDIEIMHAYRDMNRESRTYAQVISKLVGVIYGDDREGNTLQQNDDQASKGYQSR